MCHLTARETRVVCKVTVRVDVHRFQGEGDVGHGVVEGFDGEADRAVRFRAIVPRTSPAAEPCSS